MKNYIIKRLLLIVLTLAGLVTITFLVARVAPGDPARAAAGEDATQEMVETLRKEFGLDKPLYVQYVEYIKGLVTGDLGKSIRTQHLVGKDLVRYFPATFELTVFSLVMAVILGIPFGVLCAVKKDSAIDHLARVISVSGLAVPMFWLGLMLQLIFALYFDLFPTGGRLGMLTEPPPTVTHLYLIDSLLAGHMGNVQRRFLSYAFARGGAFFSSPGQHHPGQPFGHAGGFETGFHNQRAGARHKPGSHRGAIRP
jgi:peptide/nickel transport system permease protein